jgi:adenylate cyclase
MTYSMEIERKFVVPEPPSDVERHPSERIVQGYVAMTGETEVRVRRRGEDATLTIKAGEGRVRVEEEIEIGERRFASLWPLTEGRRIEKVRHLIPAPGGVTIELDVYEGALEGLVTAEVEFESEAASDSFEPPGWLGGEVTEDPRYKNRRLALEGRPE